MSKLQELIEDRFEGEFDPKRTFSLIFVANDLSADPSVVRGIVTENLGTYQRRASYFSDIDQKIREYENLPEFMVDQTLSAATALRRFVVEWPMTMTVIGTNVNTWLKPMLKALDEQFELLKGREVDVVDLGAFASVDVDTQVRSGDKLSKVLPHSRFTSRSGSLANLGAKVDVYRTSYKLPVYAEVRAAMLAEATRRYLDKEIASKEAREH